MNARFIATSLVIAVLVSGCMSAMPPTEEEPSFSSVPQTSSGTPAGRDYSTTRTSDAGLFTVSIMPDLNPVEINKIHSWTIHVELASGEIVENAAITVGGGMPEHGHGMPTNPKVTAYLGNGDYRVEGIKFQMPGWWIVTFKIEGEAGTDSVTFNLKLN